MEQGTEEGRERERCEMHGMMGMACASGPRNCRTQLSHDYRSHRSVETCGVQQIFDWSTCSIARAVPPYHQHSPVAYTIAY